MTHPATPACRAHPRSRGENDAFARAFDLAVGSSPLTRGKLPLDGDEGTGGGLIPAHAGKTACNVSRTSGEPAHPRSRGENVLPSPSVPPEAGSSPLTRGKLTEAITSKDTTRLIPAHAGKTRGHRRRSARMPAHPRSRGENIIGVVSARSPAGSSPLTRGKREVRDELSRHVRLIPAHAGKTCPRLSAPTTRRAHPRSRGENRLRGLITYGRHGSSPLTRGKRACTWGSLWLVRLIPAHAGKTPTWRTSRLITPAHPRSRGENGDGADTSVARLGSSPLTRGKPPLASVQPYFTGLIPAHAGKTSSDSSSAPSARAHPRSRGENGLTLRHARQRRGSSPLTRGKPVLVNQIPQVLGLIPAHAGKT